MPPWVRSSPSSVAGRCPSSTPRVCSRSTPPCAASVGIFDVSHLGKLDVRGTGAAAYLNRCLSNDLDRIGPGRAQYTLACDAATGGVVDDLIAYLHDEDHVLLVPNAANSAEIKRRLEAGAPEGVTDRRPARVARRAGGAGHEVGRGALGGRSADRPRLHVLRAGSLRGPRRRGVPHRLHRRARLRAGRGQRGRAGALGRAARCGRAARHAAVRARRPRHAAHRDGLPAARSGHQHRRDPQPGPAGLGRRMVQARVLGQGTARSPRRRPASA